MPMSHYTYFTTSIDSGHIVCSVDSDCHTWITITCKVHFNENSIDFDLKTPRTTLFLSNKLCFVHKVFATMWIQVFECQISKNFRFSSTPLLHWTNCYYFTTNFDIFC